MLPRIIPIMISKPKVVARQKQPEKFKEKSFYVSGDNLKPRRVKRKPVRLPPVVHGATCDCNLRHLTRVVVAYAPRTRKRGVSNTVLSTTLSTTAQRKRKRNNPVPKKLLRKVEALRYDSDVFFKRLENQLKALNLGKISQKGKNKDATLSQRSKADKDTNDGSETAIGMDDSGEVRRRGKRRRKGRQASDRLTSAGLAAQAQQDPETQIAGIGTDSQNPSSRASFAHSNEDDNIIVLPAIKKGVAKKTDSFLDDDILKYLHREVDEEAIETEFDTKRRYVLEEALRTRPERQFGDEMQTLLKEFKIPEVSLGDWLHIPRVFSRQNVQFSLPIDSNTLEDLTPMIYATRFVTIKKSKQLLYLTVLRKFRPDGYKMPIANIEEGLTLMMGGSLSDSEVKYFKSIMEWDQFVDEDNFSDDIKLTLMNDKEGKNNTSENETEKSDLNSLKYRTWCGLCGICERMFGRFPPRDKDPPDGMELSDFCMLETKLAVLNVHNGLVEMLNAVRLR